MDQIYIRQRNIGRYRKKVKGNKYIIVNRISIDIKNSDKVIIIVEKRDEIAKE